jgi:hypothetical protein
VPLNCTPKTIHHYFSAGSQAFMVNVIIATRLKVSIISNLVSDPHQTVPPIRQQARS